MTNPADLIPRLNTARDRACAEAARRAQRLARRNSPVRTGRLRASVTASGPSVRAVCPYALFVERGTRRSPARPFLLPAAREADFVSLLSDALKGAFR